MSNLVPYGQSASTNLPSTWMSSGRAMKRELRGVVFSGTVASTGMDIDAALAGQAMERTADLFGQAVHLAQGNEALGQELVPIVRTFTYKAQQRIRTWDR